MEQDKLVNLMRENGWVHLTTYGLTFYKRVNNEGCLMELSNFDKYNFKVKSHVVSRNIYSKDDIKNITIALNRLKEEEQKIRGLLENEIRNEH